MEKKSVTPGKRVKLMQDYTPPLDILEKLLGHRMGDGGREIEDPVQPAGSLGTVSEYDPSIFDYETECPVQFDQPVEGIAIHQGVPYEILEPV